MEFAGTVQEKIRLLLEESSRESASKKAFLETIDGYFDA